MKRYFIPNRFFKLFIVLFIISTTLLLAQSNGDSSTSFDLSTLFSADFLAKATAILTAIITIANLITMLTPSVTKSPIYNAIMKVLNFLSLNIFKNKNADAVK